MARYIGPTCKLARREGACSVEKKAREERQATWLGLDHLERRQIGKLGRRPADLQPATPLLVAAEKVRQTDVTCRTQDPTRVEVCGVKSSITQLDRPARSERHPHIAMFE